MDRRQMIATTGAAALGLGLSQFSRPFPTTWAADPAGPKRKILFFTRSQGYEHSVIARKGGELGFAEKILIDLGKANGFDVTATKDGRIFTPENIAQYDAFFFYTTGDLTAPGGDNQPPMSKEGKAALLAAIHDGKGFLGSHCGSDTFHSPGVDRFQHAGERLDPYLAMLGGEFIHHGAQQKSVMTVTDHKFPGFADLPASFTLLEEWYSLKDFADNLHVLLVQGTKGMTGDLYQRPDYPATWARKHGKGRVFYTSMGHRDDVWENAMFRSILLGGLSWAAGNVEADVTPNLVSLGIDTKALPKSPEKKG